MSLFKFALSSTTSGIIFFKSSYVIPPGLSIVGVSSDKSRTVDSRPMPVLPPSIIISILPSMSSIT